MLSVQPGCKKLVSKANQGYERNNIPLASPGVGGSCLIKDPILFNYQF